MTWAMSPCRTARTLVDFVSWAMKNYPADKYALIMSDHGMGWPGGWSDATTASSHDRSIPLVQVVGNNLYLMELDDALQTIQSTTGLDKFELIGLDACLMSHLEVLSALAPYGRYAVVSQETEPSLGWAYTKIFQALTDNPDMDGAELGKVIVESYIQDDQRIVDDQARADFVGRGSGMSGLFGAPVQVSAEELAQQMEKSVTLTAIDLGRVPELMDSVNNVAVALQGVNQQGVAKARSYAQFFTSIFGEEVPPSYIDLGNFAQLLKRVAGNNTQVVQAVDSMLAALGNVVIAEKHGSDKPGASGISVYYPNSQLYRSPVAGPQSYTAIADRFAEESLWDDFLAYHYTGRRFQAMTGTGDDAQRDIPVNSVVGAGRAAVVSAPGTGKIVISPVQLSGKVAAPGKPVVMTAQVTGTNVGYVYMYDGYLDEASNSIFLADMDYLSSPNTQEVDGVYYPDWGEGPVHLEVHVGTTDVRNHRRQDLHAGAAQTGALRRHARGSRLHRGWHLHLRRRRRHAFGAAVLQQRRAAAGVRLHRRERDRRPARDRADPRRQVHRPGALDGPGRERPAGDQRHTGRKDPDLRQADVHVEGAGRRGRQVRHRLHRDGPGRQQLRVARERDGAMRRDA